MFEEARLLGSPERRIIVQTRRGRDGSNSIEPEPGEQERKRYELLQKKYGGAWVMRKSGCGVYNCAGHIWAGRRTSIFEDAAWEMILEDDGYSKLGSQDEPLPGDLVIYRDPKVGFLHVGMILEMREGIAPGSRRIPWVLSKWDSASGEFMHYAHHVPPWDRQGFSVVVEFWTDRLRPGMGEVP